MSFSRSIWKIALAACLAAPFAQVKAQGTTAQNFAIVRGTVTDSASHAPVPGAQVIAVGTTRGALTDTAGATHSACRRGRSRSACSASATRRSARAMSRRWMATATADFDAAPVSTVLSEVWSPDTARRTALR